MDDNSKDRQVAKSYRDKYGVTATRIVASSKALHGHWMTFQEICAYYGVSTSSYTRARLSNWDGVEIRKVPIEVGNIRGAYRYEYRIK